MCCTKWQLSEVDDPRLKDLKLGYVRRVLTYTSRLLDLIAQPIDGLEGCGEAKHDLIAATVTGKFMEVFGDLLMPLLHALVVSLDNKAHAARIVTEELLQSVIGCSTQMEALQTVFPAPVPKAFPKSETLECEHPYPNNADLSWDLEFPGADEVVITFDPRCRTGMCRDEG